jgi:hypothetical protein
MRETTPFASFLPLNGFWMVLASDSLKIDGPLYGNNLRNKPFFIVNGGRDQLYPTDLVDPHIEHFKKHGVSLVYEPQPEAGHNTQWWPQVRDHFETFVKDHPRRPLPDTLTWETSDTAAHNRAHWLVIDKLGAAADEAKQLDDLNEVPISARPDFGLQSIGGRVVRVNPDSNAAKIGFKVGDALVRLNGETVSISTDVLETLSTVKPGSQIDVVVSRNNKPVELSGIYDPPIVSYPPRQLLRSSGPVGPRGPRAPGQHHPRDDARCERVHAAAVAGSVRLQQTRDGGGQRPHRVQRSRAEGSAHAREMGRG